MSDRTQAPTFSKALWVPLPWLILASARSRLTPERLVDVEAYEASPVVRALYAALIVVAFLILWRRCIPWQQLAHRNLWITALFALMAISIIWSDYSWISTKRFVKTVGVLLMVLIVITEDSPIEAFSALIRRYCYLTIPLSAFLIFFVPAYGQRVLADGTVYWVGVTSHKNNLGLILLLSATYFTWQLSRGEAEHRSKRNFAMLLLSLGLLAGCGSMTSFFSYLAVIATVIIIRLGRASARHAGIILVYVFAMVGMAYFLLDSIIVSKPIALMIVQLFGRDLSFTGRMDLWQDVWRFALDHPLLGHGFGGFWAGERADYLWQFYEWQPVDSHNGYLDVFAELGAFGVLIMAVIILRAYRMHTRSLAIDFEPARMRLLLFVMILAHNLNETSLCNLSHPYWFVFLFCAVSGPYDWARAPGTSSPRAESAERTRDVESGDEVKAFG